MTTSPVSTAPFSERDCRERFAKFTDPTSGKLRLFDLLDSLTSEEAVEFFVSVLAHPMLRPRHAFAAQRLITVIADHDDPPEIWLDVLWRHAEQFLPTDPDEISHVLRLARTAKSDSVRRFLAARCAALCSAPSVLQVEWGLSGMKMLLDAGGAMHVRPYALELKALSNADSIPPELQQAARQICESANAQPRSAGDEWSSRVVAISWYIEKQSRGLPFITRLEREDALQSMISHSDLSQENLEDLARAKVQAVVRGRNFIREFAKRGQRKARAVDVAALRKKVAAAKPPDAAAVEGELVRKVRQAIGRLPETARLAIEKHFFEGKTMGECATEMGLSQASVRYLLVSALSLLRRMLLSETLERGTADP